MISKKIYVRFGRIKSQIQGYSAITRVIKKNVWFLRVLKQFEFFEEKKFHISKLRKKLFISLQTHLIWTNRGSIQMIWCTVPTSVVNRVFISSQKQCFKWKILHHILIWRCFLIPIFLRKKLTGTKTFWRNGQSF